MKTMRKILMIYLMVGFAAALVFPFYANFFVIWKDGMLKYFIFGCFGAGASVGFGNYFIFKKLQKDFIATFSKKTKENLGEDLNASGSSKDLLESVILNFDKMLTTVVNNMKTIDSVATSLLEKVRTITVSAEDIALKSEEVSSHLNGLNSQVETLVDGSDKLHNQTAELSTEATHGGKLAQSAMESSSLAESELSAMIKLIEDSRSIIESLHDKVSSINNFTSKIDKIANDTNLLSLNATIEAAKAGAAGGGFAVVADRVRILAEESAQSGKDISKTVATVVMDMQSAQEQFGKNIKKIIEGTDLVKNVLIRMKDINTTVEHFHRGISIINELIEKQNDSVKSVSKFVSEISDLSKESASEASAVSESVTGILCAVDSLLSESKGLCK
ncbi:MAG: methyl-accepting chemotaxis protein [Nitrospirae bacterium]|nr:methyl-accepting chemotaxis protein [Nitrospirota bacterium]MBF0536368.1 methyl-accepting chemotaxis protein [Nitrospirota bacterium]MBF0616599.1 methyl-accepting chemotaxis protein [Nitrospirota bacterium]